MAFNPRRDTAVLEVQNDDNEIDLQFQDFGDTPTSSGKDGNKEHTIYFSNFPDSAEDDQEQKSEPKLKKCKFMEEKSSKKNSVLIPSTLTESDVDIIPILSTELTDPHFTQLVVLQIKEKKLISVAIQEISKNFIVPELQHLKRVKKLNIDGNDIFVVYVHTAKHFNIDVPTEENDNNLIPLSSNCVSSIWKALEDTRINVNVYSNVFVSKASCYAPKLKCTFNIVNKYWPCSFHEDLHLRKLTSGSYFSVDEVNNIVKFINCTLKLAETVNPEKGHQKAVIIVKGSKFESCDTFAGLDKRFVNPLLHASIIAIDVVASKQGGGALPKEYLDGEDLPKLKKNSSFKESTYNKECHKKNCLETNSSIEESVDSDYICTGYDVYMSSEPCLMCAMALLHSRVQRVFYFHSNTIKGALNSVCKLHILPGINHRYEVFNVKLKNK